MPTECHGTTPTRKIEEKLHLDPERGPAREDPASSYVKGKEKKTNATSYGHTGPMGDGDYDHQQSSVVTVWRVVRAVHDVSGTSLTRGLRGGGLQEFWSQLSADMR